MEKILVYLGSDHVIQHPSFGVRENAMMMTTDRKAAISQACKQDATGVVNSYYLDLDSLSIKAPEQQVLDGFDCYDKVIPQEELAGYISIRSEAWLKFLLFENAFLSVSNMVFWICSHGNQIVNFSIMYCKSLYNWV